MSTESYILFMNFSVCINSFKMSIFVHSLDKNMSTRVLKWMLRSKTFWFRCYFQQCIIILVQILGIDLDVHDLDLAKM